MNKLTRFGVSIEEDLLDKFEKLNARKKYQNRSEAIRELIREKLAQHIVENENALVFGVISCVYDHHKREIQKQMNSIQHDSYKSVVFTTHIHIDHDNCFEIIILKDKAGKIKNISDNIIGLKGVKHGKLNFISS